MNLCHGGRLEKVHYAPAVAAFGLHFPLLLPAANPGVRLLACGLALHKFHKARVRISKLQIGNRQSVAIAISVRRQVARWCL